MFTPRMPSSRCANGKGRQGSGYPTSRPSLFFNVRKDRKQEREEKVSIQLSVVVR